MNPEEQLLWDIFSIKNREKEEMEIKDARRKSFDVKYVVVTEKNIEEVATWCGGEVGGEGTERFVQVTDKNAISARQTKAFVDDYVLKMSETGASFKAFTEKAFKKSYEPIVASGKKDNDLTQDLKADIAAREIARSAKSGQFVSHEEAEANPDTTVVEQVRVTRHDSEIGPDGKILLKGKAFSGETQILLPDTNAEAKDPEEWSEGSEQ